MPGSIFRILYISRYIKTGGKNNEYDTGRNKQNLHTGARDDERRVLGWSAGNSLPLGEPHSFRVSLSGMGLSFRGNTPPKCTTILGDDKR